MSRFHHLCRQLRIITFRMSTVCLSSTITSSSSPSLISEWSANDRQLWSNSEVSRLFSSNSMSYISRGSSSMVCKNIKFNFVCFLRNFQRYKTNSYIGLILLIRLKTVWNKFKQFFTASTHRYTLFKFNTFITFWIIHKF